MLLLLDEDEPELPLDNPEVFDVGGAAGRGGAGSCSIATSFNALASIWSVASLCFFISSCDSNVASLTTFVMRSCGAATPSCHLMVCALCFSQPSMSARQAVSNLMEIRFCSVVGPADMLLSGDKVNSSRSELRQQNLDHWRGWGADVRLRLRLARIATHRAHKALMLRGVGLLRCYEGRRKAQGVQS